MYNLYVYLRYTTVMMLPFSFNCKQNKQCTIQFEDKAYVSAIFITIFCSTPIGYTF